MIIELIEQVLPRGQFKKMKKLLEAKPEILSGKPVVLGTSELQEITGIRSNNVFRDLTNIGERLGGRFVCERAYVD